MNITIKCPICGGEILVPSTVGIETKTLNCPQCKHSAPLKDYLPKISLKVDGVNYQLYFGRQRVGRENEGNEAEVQIPDETRYMSRFHAIIDLHCTASGIECTFEEHGKNPTFIESIQLINNDIIFLNINDCLKLGSKKMYLAGEFGNTTVKQK